jgi:hypothetical protein
MVGSGKPVVDTGWDTSLRPRIARRSSVPTWRDAVRRGAILASVFACHLIILMMVLYPSWHRVESVTAPRESEVLQLTLDPVRKISRFLPVTTRAPVAAKTKPAPSAIESAKVTSAVVEHPANPSPSTAAALIVTVPSLPDDLHRSYQPGDFQTALGDSQRTKAEHIPGASASVIGGIQLQDRSSVKETVHAVTEYIRCTDEQLNMQHGHDQFSTAQQMDRALQLDGCGPHLEHSAVNDEVDAVAHRAIFGN